jgi:hypothetical protein
MGAPESYPQRRLTMAAPSFVFTIAKVADMLGEDRALLEELAIGMEPQDGRLLIVDIDEDTSVTAFTQFGVEYLQQLLLDFKALRPPAAGTPGS